MGIQKLPELRQDGTYDPVEVVLYARIVGEATAAKQLNLSIDRIAFFTKRMKEERNFVTKGKNK